ncbi:unnamed protein product [Brassica oleracea]
MKKTQVHVMVISLIIHLAASRVEDVVVDAPAYRRKWAFMKTTVQISNRLSGGLTLILHCKSKNNDLGVQTLAPDSSWSFHFRPNILEQYSFSVVLCGLKKHIRLIFMMIIETVFVRVIHASTVRGI